MDKLFSQLDKRYVKVCAYASATVVLTLAVCMLLWAASPVFDTVWKLICSVVEPLVYGAALSYVLNPLVTRVSHALAKRPRYRHDGARRRGAAVAISLVLVLLLVLVIVAIFVLMVTHSIASLRWDAIQALFDSARGDFAKLIEMAESSLQDLGLITRENESNLLTVFTGAKNTATTVLFAVVFSVYFLIDGPRVAGYLSRVLHALMGEHQIRDYSRLLADADQVFSGYFRGQGIDALIMCVLTGIVLSIVGVPFAPMVGLLTGLGNLIPYVGGPVGFGSVILMCLPTADWGTMIAGLIAMALVMFVDGNIINPKLLSDNVEVHPILVVVALIAGGAVGGLAGMLVAVPTAAFIKIQVDRMVEKHEAAQAPTSDED